MNKLSYLILCIACITLTECKTSSKTASATPATPATPVTAEANPSPAPAVPDIVIAGQSVYNGKCGRCHDLPKPNQYDQFDWASIMVKMSRKAHLSDDETAQVLAFVNANAKQ